MTAAGSPATAVLSASRERNIFRSAGATTKQKQRPDEHTTHDDGGQRALHLASDTVGYRGREQTDAGRQRGHQHRPHALLGAVKHSFGDAHALRPELAEIGDVENAVHHRDAEQRDEADRRRDGEIKPGEIKRDQAAADRKGNAGHRQQAVAQRIEQPVQQHKDQQQRDRHHDQQPLLGVLQIRRIRRTRRADSHSEA